MIKFFQEWWNVSSPFRHALTTFVSIQLALPLAQVASWAQSSGFTPLPDWRSVLADLGYASVAAIIAALIKAGQNHKAFPPEAEPKPPHI